MPKMGPLRPSSSAFRLSSGRARRQRLFWFFVVLLGGFALFYARGRCADMLQRLGSLFGSFFGSLRGSLLGSTITSSKEAGKSASSSATTAIPPGKAIHGALRMLHHHVNKPGEIQIPNTERDACRILMDCYPDPTGIYGDLATCHRSLNSLATWLDSSVMIHGERIVGFISFHHQQARLATGPRHALLTYNVCVDPAYRGRGLATRMLAEGLEEMLDHYRLRDQKRLLLALDVDLTSPMAAESFSLYGKLGYLRGWQPCRSIGDVDWRPFYYEEEEELRRANANRTNPSSSPAPASTIIVPEAIRHPLDRILWTPAEYRTSELQRGEGRGLAPRLRSLSGAQSRAKYDHFCMFKWYGESWLTMGQFLAAPFRPAEAPQ